MVPAVSIRGTYSDFWLQCSSPNCNTFYDTFIPMPYQAEILADSHRRLGIFGGYGCGKTTTTYKSDEKHIQLTPGGETLIGANTLIQLENTIKKDLEGDLPYAFVKSVNKQLNTITFVNGHVLYYRPLEKEGDIRSYNLTRAHILEASEVKRESYVQLQARVRNEAAVKPRLDENGARMYRWNKQTKAYELVIDYDWLQLLIESNPDSGWIKEDVLLRSSVIKNHGEPVDYNILPELRLDSISTHVIPTKANYNLPPHFYSDLAADKPLWWILRYLEGSFEYREGLVYPNLTKALIPSFAIPNHWPIVIGFDYGLNDNSHFVFAALDFEGEKFGKPAVFFFREVVKSDLNIVSLASEYKRVYNEVVRPGALYTMPVMDSRSYALRSKEGEKKTIGTLFAEQGCIFNKAQMNKDVRILKLNALIDLGNAYFFSDGVPHLIHELQGYKYPDRSLDKNVRIDKPVDKNDHGISAAEFIAMEVPPQMKRQDTRVMRLEDIVMNNRSNVENYDPFFSRDAQQQEDTYEGFGSIFHF
jgi:hypothetical protein